VGSGSIGAFPHGFRLVIAYGAAVTALLAFGPFSNYSPAGHLDPWIYTGYFLNLGDLVDRYGYQYYVSRVAHVLPGVALYKAFPPVLANFAFHAIAAVTAAVGLHRLLRPYSAPGLSFLLCLCFLANAYVASTLNWDYPSGLPIALVLLGSSFAFVPTRHLGRTTNLFIAGACWAAGTSIHNTAALVVIPGGVAYFAMHHKDPLKQLVRDAGCLVLGGVLALALLSVAAYLALGTFDILGPQFRQARYAARTPGYLEAMYPTLSGSQWMNGQYRIWIFLAPAIAALTLYFSSRRAGSQQTYLAAVLLWLLLSMATYAIADFAGGTYQLRVYYTSAFLLAPAFAVLGLCAGLASKGRGSAVSYALLLAACALPFVHESVVEHAGRITEAGRWTVLGLSSLPFVCFAWGGRSRAALMSSMAVLLAGVNIAPILQSETRVVFHDTRFAFDAALRVSKLIRNNVSAEADIKFWYEQDDPRATLFNSLNSLYLWDYQDFNRILQQDVLRASRLLRPGVEVVHLASSTEAFERRRIMLDEKGFSTSSRHQERIVVDGYSFFLQIARVETVPAPPMTRPPSTVQFAAPLFEADSAQLRRLYRVASGSRAGRPPPIPVEDVNGALHFTPLRRGDYVHLPFQTVRRAHSERWMKIEAAISGGAMPACRIVVQGPSYHELEELPCPTGVERRRTFYLRLPEEPERFRLVVHPIGRKPTPIPNYISIAVANR